MNRYGHISHEGALWSGKKLLHRTHEKITQTISIARAWLPFGVSPLARSLHAHLAIWSPLPFTCLCDNSKPYFSNSNINCGLSALIGHASTDYVATGSQMHSALHLKMGCSFSKRFKRYSNDIMASSSWSAASHFPGMILLFLTCGIESFILLNLSWIFMSNSRSLSLTKVSLSGQVLPTLMHLCIDYFQRAEVDVKYTPHSFSTLALR